MNKKKNLWSLFIILMVAMSCFSVISCSGNDEEENQISIKNLSGVDWYNATVIFKESINSDSKVIKMIKVEDVPVGSSCSVNKEGMFLYIDARNKHGKFIMSDIVYTSENITISSYNILIY